MWFSAQCHNDRFHDFLHWFILAGADLLDPFERAFLVKAVLAFQEHWSLSFFFTN
jgi:hypothetical protein